MLFKEPILGSRKDTVLDFVWLGLGRIYHCTFSWIVVPGITARVRGYVWITLQAASKCPSDRGGEALAVVSALWTSSQQLIEKFGVAQFLSF